MNPVHLLNLLEEVPQEMFDEDIKFGDPLKNTYDWSFNEWFTKLLNLATKEE